MEKRNGSKKDRSKARFIRRTKETIKHLPNRAEHSESGRKSSSRGTEQIRIDREIREGHDRECHSTASPNNGGVISQLLEEERLRLARLQNEVEQQKQRIQLLEATIERLNEITDSEN